MLTLQELIRRLNDYWSSQGCVIMAGYDTEVGAGTSHPATALKCLGPEAWNVAYVQPSRRPADGRYARNPMRNQRYYQYQVILKPSPENVVDLYMESLNALGFDTKKNDIRLVEDDWENPSLGAAGVGWEVWLDGTEISQFTFFQQMGGIECSPVCAELTYGPERLTLMLNGQNSFWEDLMWNDRVSYRQAEWQLEMEHNVYNFEVASTEMLLQLFEMYEAESKRVIETPVYWDADREILTATEISTPSPFSGMGRGQGVGESDFRTPSLTPVGEGAGDGESGPNSPSPLAGEGAGGEGSPKTPPPNSAGGEVSGPGSLALVHPAFDLALKCSHIFNVLDARGAVSVTQRAAYIQRIRARVRACCLKYVEQFQREPAPVS